MQPIAMFTKIHGKGNVELIINDVLDKEVTRQREAEKQTFDNMLHELEIEMRCMNLIMSKTKNQRDDLRKERIEAIKKQVYHKRFVEKIKYAFFFCFACVLVWGGWLKEEAK